jgi:translin
MNLEKADKELMELHDARDDLLAKRQSIIMKCAKGIRAVHIEDYDTAEKKLKEAKKELEELEKKTADKPRINCFLMPCHQEVVELEVLLGVIKKGELPDVNAPADAYLTGVLDALGELKRTAMGMLMKGEYDEAMKLYEKMEEIYYSMEGFTFPNSLVDGFKHKQDVMKKVLERLYETLAEAKMRGSGSKKH